MSKLNWKKVIGWGVAALVVIGVVGFNAWQNNKIKERKFVIAVNLPMSGPIASATKPYVNGLKMGISDELNTNNISQNDVYLDIGDNRGNATDGVTLYHKHSTSSFDVYISGVADVTKAFVKLADKNQKPHFLVAFDKHMPELGKNRIRILPNFNIEAPLYLNFISQRNPKKVFLISHDSNVNQELFSSDIEPYLERNNIEYKRENIGWTFVDYRTLSQKIEEYNPDLILINAFSGEMIKLLSTMQEYNLIKKNNVYAGLDFLDFIYQKEIPYFTKDITFTASQFDLSDYDSKFKKRYRELYNEEPTYISAYGYDTGRLIIKAFAQNGKVDVDGILSQTPYQGISGSIEMDTKTRDLKSTLIPATLDENGKIVPVTE